MNKNLLPANLLFLFIVMLMASGCLNPLNSIGGNFKEDSLYVVQDTNRGSLSFNQAIRYCTSSDFGGHQLSQNVTLHYIQARNVTMDGNAESWIFGIVDKGNPFYYIINGDNVQKMDWNQGGYYSNSINLQHIITPDKLFIKRPLFFKELAYNGKIFELKLENGIYMVKSYNGPTNTQYRINAISGEIME